MNFSIKKILLTTFIILEVSALFAFSAFPISIDKGNLGSSSLLRPKISFSFEIARRRDCLGFGICNWTATITVDRINSCSGTVYLDEANKNVFVFEIDKAKGISASAYEKYLKSGIFLMEDEVPVPGDVLKALGISGNKTLPAGSHKVTERDGLLYITIPAK